MSARGHVKRLGIGVVLWSLYKHRYESVHMKIQIYIPVRR